jgi:calmodulin
MDVELAAMLSRTRPVNPEQDLRAAFKVFDLDGDGMISQKELKLVMHSLGHKFSNREIEEMIKEADSNRKSQYD